MINRDEYVQKLKTQIDQLNAEASHWEEKARKAQAGMKAEYERQLEQVRARSQDALAELRRLQSASNHAFGEGLLLPRMQEPGLAFLDCTLDVKGPTLVADTIHVECEVIEHRLTSKGDRGLVRFANKVINQRGETVLEYNPLRLLKRK